MAALIPQAGGRRTDRLTTFTTEPPTSQKVARNAVRWAAAVALVTRLGAITGSVTSAAAVRPEATEKRTEPRRTQIGVSRWWVAMYSRTAGPCTVICHPVRSFQKP